MRTIWATLILVVTACSGGGSSDGSAGSGGASAGGAGGTNGVGADCGAYADALCSRLAECWPLKLFRDYENEAICREAVADDCAADADAGAARVDARGCASSLSTASCEDVADPPTGPCDFAAGGIPAGMQCALNEACASGQCSFSGDRCGVCTDVAGLGDPCGDGCGIGLVCEQGQCVEFTTNDAGGRCNTPTEGCRSFLSCDSGECVLPAQEGESCTDVMCNNIGFLECVMDRCEPSGELVALGEPCGLPFPRCSDQAFCDPDQRVCVPRKTVGESCTDDPVKGDTCISRVECVDGTCLSFDQQCG